MSRKPSYEELEQRVRELEHIQKNDERYRNLFNNMLYEIHIWQLVFDNDGNIKTWKLVDANPAALKSWGKNLSEIIGKTTDEIFSISNPTELFMPVVKKIFSEGNPHIWETYFPDTKQFLHMVSIPFGEYFISTGLDISVQKKNEKILQESEEKFRNLFDNSPTGKTITYVSGEMQSNNAFAEVLGYSKDEFQNFNWQDITHQDDMDFSQKVVESIISGEKEVDRFTKRYIHKNGSIVWADVSTRVQRDSEGAPHYFITAVIDITEQKRMEEELKISERKFRNLAENVPGVILKYKLNPDGSDELLYISKSVEDIFEVSQEDAKNNNKLLWDRIYDDDLEEYNESIKRSAENLSIWEQEHRLQFPDGRVKWVFTRGIPTQQDDGSIVWDTLAMDITKQKQAELKAADTLKILSMAEKVAKLGSWRWNPNTNEVQWSDNMCRLYGIKPSDFDPTFDYASHFTHPDDIDIVEKYVNSLLNEKCQPPPPEYRIITPKNEILWVQGSSQVLLDDKGNIKEILGTMQDITARKKTEEEFFQIFSMSLDMLCVADINTATFLRVNPAFTHILGYSDQELLERPFFDFIHPDDIDTTVSVVEKKLKAGEKVINFSNRYRCKDGSYRWLSWVSHPNLTRGVTYAIARDITDIKYKDELLRKNKALLDATGHMAKIGGWELDVKTSEVTWTDETYHIHEVPMDYNPPLEEAINFFHPDDRKKLSKAIQLATEHGEPYDMEVRFITAKGNHLWTRTVCSPQVENGKVVKLYGTFQDITEQKKYQDALRESEERYDLAMNATKDGIFDWNLITSEIYYSPGWKSILGYGYDELPNDFSVWEKLTAPEDVKRSWKMQNELIERKRDRFEIEFKMKHKNGHWVDILSRANAVFDDNGKAIRIVGTHVDITDRKKAEQEILKQKQNIERYLNLAGVMFIGLDDKGIINLSNKKASEILECDNSEILGMNWFDNFIPENVRTKVRSVFKELVAGNVKPVEYYENLIITKTGKEKEIAWHNTVIKDDSDRIIGILSSGEDITIRKQYEKQILQSQKLEAIGTLAGGIAHDFNNMLGVMMGNVSYLLSRYGEDKELVEVLADIEEGALKSQQLTQQLLTFAKGGAPVKKSANINKILEDSVGFITRGTKTKCNFDLSDELWITEVDSGQLNQVINNLLINANQAMPNGGIIEIRSENAEIKADSNIPLPTGKYIKVIVEDQGVGISERQLPYIFDPYFSTKQTGSGLGLATTYSIIKNHGGHIGVESKIDKGTTFYIYLPVSDKEIQMADDTSIFKHSGNGKILVMDDDDAILKVSKRILSSMGYEVVFATEGLEAVKLYKNSFTTDNKFDLVILDLTVPGKMGGAEVIPEILKINPEAKVIVSSGYSNDPIMASYKEYGLAGVIPKPYRRQQMADLLNEIMGDKE